MQCSSKLNTSSGRNVAEKLLVSLVVFGVMAVSLSFAVVFGIAIAYLFVKSIFACVVNSIKN